MSRSWVVMFDNEGLDLLIPWSDLLEDSIISKLAGEEPFNKREFVARAILRAQLNSHRNTEIWGFDTKEDMTVDKMLSIWRHEDITALKDLVRSKGDKLY